MFSFSYQNNFIDTIVGIMFFYIIYDYFVWSVTFRWLIWMILFMVAWYETFPSVIWYWRILNELLLYDAYPFSDWIHLSYSVLWINYRSHTIILLFWCHQIDHNYLFGFTMLNGTIFIFSLTRSNLVLEENDSPSYRLI